MAPSLIYSQRALEDTLSLADVLRSGGSLPARTSGNSSSIRDLEGSGAFPSLDPKSNQTSSTHQRDALLEATSRGRLAAYMSMDRMSVARTHGYRTRAAYRMVSYMARICGHLQGPMTLAMLHESNILPDPFTIPFEPPACTAVYGASGILAIVNNSDRFQYLPPDPQSDVSFGTWLDAYSMLADHLAIYEGTEEEPASGVFGTIGMFGEDSARYLWPVGDELLMYEQELMLRLFDNLCCFSVQEVEQQAMKELGYRRPEAVMICKTALRYGVGVYESDLDMAKIRELKSLEVISDTARRGDDPRAQIAARKQMHLIYGLTKDASSEQGEEFRLLAGKALDEPEVD